MLDSGQAKATKPRQMINYEMFYQNARRIKVKFFAIPYLNPNGYWLQKNNKAGET
jgi:hypothetical protein